MKTTAPIRFLVLTLVLLATHQLSAQIIMSAPEPYDPPAPGDQSFTKICANIDTGSGSFNSYDMTISWAGALPNAGNAFILELSDASGDFTNPIELANITDQNTNATKSFEVNFAVPSTVGGQGHIFRARSTDPVSATESVDAFSVYYIDVDYNLNISEMGDGNPPGNLCDPTQITLQVDNIPSPETHKYLWFRSSSPISGETGHSINVTTSGLYQAFIDYGDCVFNANTDSNLVNVTIGATGVGVGITPPSKTALCAGETETLAIDTTDPAWSYQWYKDDTTIPGAIATSYVVDGNTANFAGDYQIEISAPGVCTERSVSVTMTSAGGFTVTRNNPANIVVLPAQPETLSISTTANSPTYQWYRNNNAVVGSTNSTLDITQNGAYYVDVTSTGACSSTTSSENTIALVPTSFEVIIDYDASYTSCENTSIILEVATINAVASDGSTSDVTAQLETAFTYQWNRSGSPIPGATSQNISLTNPTENGNYIVNASLDSYNETSSQLPVQLLTSETVSITSTGTIFCSGADALTISTTTDLSVETFDWEKDGVLMSVSTEELVVSETGTYRLVLDKNSCNLYSNEIIISGLDPDLITLDIDGDVIFPEGSSKTVRASGGTAYQWFDSDNNVIGASDSIIFTEEGTYRLVAEIDNCQVSKQLTVIYLDTFKVPNVITPNGDGSNDQWVIPNSYSSKSDVSVIIYNDKGIELLNETNYQNNWPESSISFPNQNMVFYYVIKNPSETLKQGTITVIR